MNNFFTELKRRHIYRVAAAYSVVAWLLIQIVANIAPMLDLPAWIGRAVVLVLAAGFPVALVFAWVHELKAADPPSPVKTGAAEWMLAAVAVAVIGIFAYQQFAAPVGAPEAGVDSAREAAVKPAGISVAVLPFENLSGDADQEFFSDGMTEEITAALAKVPDLRVVARTSAFQFKAQNRDIQSIGPLLHATHYIEGSVRKAGTRVRITAQLIKTDDGTHVWAENYDRELTDVFATQEEIATAIARALRVPLGLKPGETLVHGTQNLGTYQEYLQAKAWLRDRTSPRSVPFRQILETLESVAARDPGFAPAWAALASFYPADKAEKAAQKAIQLDPRHPSGYAAMARFKWTGGQWAAAEDMVKQGLALDPNDPDVLGNYWNILLKTGRPKEALAVAEKLQTLEPLVAAYTTNVAMNLQVDGQNEAAIAAFEAIPANVRSILADRYLARAYAAAGRYAEGADTLLRAASVATNPAVRKELQDAAAVLRTAPAKAVDPKALPNLGGDLIFIYAAVGALDRVMDDPELAAQNRNLTDPGKTLWAPNMAPVRKTERFKAFARNAGLVDYWRERGWPEFCHPTTGDDFECE